MFSFNLVIVEAVIIKGLNFENWVIDTNFGLNQRKWHTFLSLLWYPLAINIENSTKVYQKEVTETQKRLSMIILERSGKEENVYPNLLDRESLQLNGEEFEKKILIAFYRLSHLYLSIYPIFCCTILLRIQKKRTKKKEPKKTPKQTNNNNTGNPKDRHLLKERERGSKKSRCHLYLLL